MYQMKQVGDTNHSFLLTVIPVTNPHHGTGIPAIILCGDGETQHLRFINPVILTEVPTENSLTWQNGSEDYTVAHFS